MRKRSSIKNEQGQAMTEFAMILPLLVVLFLAIFQFGIAFNNYVTITDAARAGARKAAVSRQSGNPVDDCQNQVYAAADNLNSSELQVTCAYDPSMQPGTTVQVEVDYPYSINIFGWSVSSGMLKSVMKERLE